MPAMRSPSVAFVRTHKGDFDDEGAPLFGTHQETSVEEEPTDEIVDKDPDNKDPWGVAMMVGLFIVLGASGWWSNNTINNENPVFVDQTPEGNRFATLGSFACQIGNIFPIVYKSITGFFLSEQTRRKIVAPSVYVGLMCGAVILAVCAFFWKETVEFQGQKYSGLLLLCCVISGGIGCMSNVTYWAFASRYPVYCTKAMSTGMTFGGLLGSAIILGQNAGCNPSFSAETYFLVGVAVQLVMLVGTLPILRFNEEASARAAAREAAEEAAAANAARNGLEGGLAVNAEDTERTPLVSSASMSVNSDGDAGRGSTGRAYQPAYINRDGFILCCICFIVYGMTYALAPMMPYVLKGYEANSPGRTNSSGGGVSSSMYMPYTEDGGIQDPALFYLPDSALGLPSYGNGTAPAGNGGCNASDSSSKDGLYRWAIVCQQIGDVSGRVSTAFGTPKHLATLVALAVAAALLFMLFCVATAMSSSVPLWLPGNAGYVIPALLLCYYFLRGFCVTSSYVWVKMNMPQRDAERLSSNLGMLGQVGALSGNILMVLLSYFVLQPL